jgi:hypothetical protein
LRSSFVDKLRASFGEGRDRRSQVQRVQYLVSQTVAIKSRIRFHQGKRIECRKPTCTEAVSKALLSAFVQCQCREVMSLTMRSAVKEKGLEGKGACIDWMGDDGIWVWPSPSHTARNARVVALD